MIRGVCAESDELHKVMKPLGIIQPPPPGGAVRTINGVFACACIVLSARPLVHRRARTLPITARPHARQNTLIAMKSASAVSCPLPGMASPPNGSPAHVPRGQMAPAAAVTTPPSADTTDGVRGAKPVQIVMMAIGSDNGGTHAASTVLDSGGVRRSLPPVGARTQMAGGSNKRKAKGDRPEAATAPNAALGASNYHMHADLCQNILCEDAIHLKKWLIGWRKREPHKAAEVTPRVFTRTRFSASHPWPLCCSLSLSPRQAAQTPPP